MSHTPNEIAKSFSLVKFLENIIFNVRWVLIPFYFGLIAVLVMYSLSYMQEIFHMITTNAITPDKMMLTILEFVDMVMVANLVKMIITGSYNSFVSKGHGYVNENISSGMLKVKMSTSIIGVSSIHLLQSFVNAHAVGWDEIYKQLMIHTSFIVGAIAMIVIEYYHVKTEEIEHRLHKPNH